MLEKIERPGASSDYSLQILKKIRWLARRINLITHKFQTTKVGRQL